MTDLLPCPFCGGEAVMSELDDEDERRFWVRTVTCLECDASIKEGINWNRYIFLGDEAPKVVGEKVSAAWNRRALPAATQPEAEASDQIEGACLRIEMVADTMSSSSPTHALLREAVATIRLYTPASQPEVGLGEQLEKDFFGLTISEVHERLEKLSPTPTPAAQEAEPMARCEYCDGTGDVHRADGEWLGSCDCATPAPVVPAEGLDALVTQLQGIAEKRYDMGRRTLTIADADVISRAIRALRAQQPAAPVSGVTVRRKPTMTVDRNALAALIKAVEGGTFLMDVLSDGRTERIAHEAFSGSLDAAAALHEALLPGASWTLWSPDETLDNSGYGCNLPGQDSSYSTSPARAWLLAILRALAAEGDDAQR